jgi:site-specific recombinase XerD
MIDDYEIATHESYTPQYLSKEFLRFRRLAGVADGKTLHSLRHTFAARALTETRNIQMVKQLMGHQDIHTTEIYLNFPIDYLKEVIGEVLLPASKRAIA